MWSGESAGTCGGVRVETRLSPTGHTPPGTHRDSGFDAGRLSSHHARPDLAHLIWAVFPLESRLDAPVSDVYGACHDEELRGAESITHTRRQQKTREAEAEGKEDGDGDVVIGIGVERRRREGGGGIVVVVIVIIIVVVVIVVAIIAAVVVVVVVVVVRAREACVLSCTFRPDERRSFPFL